jgi:transposase InsO family protein
MAQVARNISDPVDGFLRRHRALIIDRDSKFTEAFRERLRHAGVEVILTPYMAPNANAFAERFVLSIKSECLERMIFFGHRRFQRLWFDMASGVAAGSPLSLDSRNATAQRTTSTAKIARALFTKASILRPACEAPRRFVSLRIAPP